jgi:hypothetical protein
MNIHKNARTTPYSRLLMARRVAAGGSRRVASLRLPVAAVTLAQGGTLA